MTVTHSRVATESLTVDDAEAVARICHFAGLGTGRIRWELERPATHAWLGVRSADGRLAAVHRALRWDRYLLLKGLCIDPALSERSVGLALALAIRDLARDQGCAGVAAWVEPNHPESHLAARLRLRPATGLLHRYWVPAPDVVGSGVDVDGTGVLELTVGKDVRPLVNEVLRLDQPRPEGTRLAWLMDRNRMLLSGTPCASIDGLGSLLRDVSEASGVVPKEGFEVLFEAADLAAGLVLAGTGGHRLSRTPVRLAVYEFGVGASQVDAEPAAREMRGVS